jgi:pyruvate/2-oxoglutarate dehydrogenase complex dihydrolipoamide dehydrogenase (E3) component
MPDRWDLAIVGSGPAGCAAARRAGELGLSTLLVTDAPAASPDTHATVVRGRARLAGPDRLRVETSSGLVDHQARAIVLATGTRPSRLPGVDPDGRRILNAAPASTEGSLVILGAGPTGLAMAAAAINAGRQVTLVEIRNHLLPGLDPDLGATIASRLASGGAKILTGHRAARVEDMNRPSASRRTPP